MVAPPRAPLVAIGLDGAPAGWAAASLYADTSTPKDATVWETRLTLLADLDSVDFRPCDMAARVLLKGRGNAVFAPPARYMLPVARDYGAIRALVAELREREPAAKSLSAQAAGIAPKVAEVDAFVRERPGSERWLWECHPELSFLMLNGGEPLTADKRSAAGLTCRLRLVGAGERDRTGLPMRMAL